jgi:hypothetical protein
MSEKKRVRKGSVPSSGKTRREWDRAFLLPCPHCGAGQEEPCRAVNGRRKAMCSLRIEAATLALRAQRDPRQRVSTLADSLEVVQRGLFGDDALPVTKGGEK